MQSAKQAIRVARIEDGWSWTLTSGEGALAATGMAAEQQAAMEIAWRTARSVSQGAGFPDIIVEPPPGPERRSRRRR